MIPSISKTRQNLFTLVEQAAKGEKVEFVYKGQTFRIVPVERPSKLARLKPMSVLAEGTTFEDLEQARQDMRRQVLDSWERDNGL